MLKILQTDRGYIGMRIYGLIKKKWLATFAVGILFIIMHFPYRMIAYGMTVVTPIRTYTMDNRENAQRIQTSILKFRRNKK